MINKLRNRFIRIATLSVAAVMLLLTAILNVANYAATDADLRSTLQLISDNRGTIPLPEKPGDVPRLDRQPPEQPRADGDTAPAGTVPSRRRRPTPPVISSSSIRRTARWCAPTCKTSPPSPRRIRRNIWQPPSTTARATAAAAATAFW